MKGSRIWWFAALAFAASSSTPQPGWGQEPLSGMYPTRVLVTNDNGIDDPKIVALARAFSEVAETWVVAPSRDRSGSGSYVVVANQGFLDAEERELGPGIRAFAVDGYPADCVVLALAGLMRSSPPDLVVSGINGGENAGGDWMFSGTVGAARVAAFAGVPSLAVSGLDDDLPGAVDAAVDWVVRLARSDVVRDMEPHAYLTVSMPRTVPDSIMGVRITDRAPLMAGPELAATSPTRWQIVGQQTVRSDSPSDSDVSALEQGFIAVVPMRLDEVDVQVLTRWRRLAPSLPGWP